MKKPAPVKKRATSIRHAPIRECVRQLSRVTGDLWSTWKPGEVSSYWMVPHGKHLLALQAVSAKLTRAVYGPAKKWTTPR